MVNDSSAMLGSTCKDCRFWGLIPQNMQQGVCRRMPPTFALVLTQQGPQSVPAQPNTAKDHPACGEFQPRMKLV